MRKWMAAVLVLFMVGFVMMGTLLPGTVHAAGMITWSEKKSGTYDKIHPYTLNWTGDVLDKGGLNLSTMKVTTSSSEADFVINQYGSIGAAAILKLGSETLEAPTSENLSGFTNSLQLEQGAVYLILLHDDTFAKIRIDRVVPDDGSSITKVSFSYVLEVFEEEEELFTGGGTGVGSKQLQLGSPAEDIKNPAAVYEFEEDGSILIPWNPLDGEVSWDIYRSDNGAPYVKMTDFKLDVPEYVDNYTFVDHTYLYKVVGYASNGSIIDISPAIVITIVAGSAPTEGNSSAPSGQGNKIELKIGNKQAVVNGKAHTLDVAPFIHDGRTVVPLRFVGEALGATVDWNGKEKSITLKRGNDTIVLVIGRSEATVNGKVIHMDVPAFIHNGSTMVPIRFVSEHFNQNIKFDDKTLTILIEGNGSAPANSPGQNQGQNQSENFGQYQGQSTAPNQGKYQPPASGVTPVEYYIGEWDMWIPAGQQGASGGMLGIYEDGTILFYWNGVQTGSWTYDENTGNLLLIGYKSGWDWTVTATDEGIRVSSYGVYETGTPAD